MSPNTFSMPMAMGALTMPGLVMVELMRSSRLGGPRAVMNACSTMEI